MGHQMTSDPKEKKQTRHFTKPKKEEEMPRRSTSPLDVVPWVIEFRVVGTAATIQLQVSEKMVIGRGDSENKPEIDLSDHGAYTHGVSRNHAQIQAKNDRITIRDLNSTNGTRLNGYVLSPEHEYRLRHGDELMVGRLRLQVLFAVVPTNDETGEVLKAAEEVIEHVGSGQHILIVEDDIDVAAVYRLTLEQAGFTVTLTHSGGAALGFMTNTLPEALVMDLMLSDVSGPDLVRFVRKQEGGENVPIIIVSGATGGFQMNQALQAGADIFMGKPVNVHELVKTVGTLVVEGQTPNPQV